VISKTKPVATHKWKWKVSTVFHATVNFEYTFQFMDKRKTPFTGQKYMHFLRGYAFTSSSHIAYIF